ncbi:hypothetical protein TTHERM_000113149 (macronuclear) [Tetrahymena thermophila SB210]|uniref:Cytochrome c domain-containing protein n=1 Tax=Tetrahymena thermophila (strain SB210) TaxID=312017 RepID=W7XJP9_TETTS|nr:hypothetical protein TTHERM_000113149 [Tetrahymena thermophila SB210]EWS75776.1 hypothetical protein TTHERM_000113149 [Tetrahymena thermophila SB210]|eukprot:XP_012651698.1 hypothetical protein TTHERM_000113149 [Tetrahymena thermophila SB210]
MNQNIEIVQDTYQPGKTTFQNNCNTCHGYDTEGDCSFLMSVNSIAPQKSFKTQSIFTYKPVNFNFQYGNKDEVSTIMDQIKRF